MSFANPIFFWVFLSLIPLIAIYLLKVKPVRKPTTAFFLWANIFQEKKATSLFQRLRDLLSLLLMMLAFAAIVFALVRPDISGDKQKDLVLLIDNSASMNTSEGMSTRLDQAKKVARQIVRALNGAQRCSIAAVSNEATYYSHLTDNPRELLDAIDKISPSLMPSKIAALTQFGEKEVSSKESTSKPPVASDTVAKTTESSNVDNKNEDESAASAEEKTEPQPSPTNTVEKYRVVFITDGCLNVPESETLLPLGIEVLKVGDSGQANVGIVACDMQRIAGGQNRVGVFFQIVSTFDETIEVDLTLAHETEDNMVKLIPLEIQPGLNPVEVFEMNEAESGRWFVRLEVDTHPDSLADDNVAFLTLPPKRPIPVSVVATDRYFFENSVLAFSRSGGLLQLIDSNVPGDANPQIIIGKGNSLAKDDTATDVLVFQPDGESDWWSELGEEIEVTLPRKLDENHPVIRHLDTNSIPFIGARRLTPPPGAEIWVVAEDDTPLIYRTTKAGRTAIIVNLDPLASDFYFSAWFPVLVYSSATHLAGRTEAVRATYPTGDFANIPGIDKGEKTSVWAPSEIAVGESAIPPDETTETLLGPLKTTGHYTLSNQGGDWQVACSLLSPTESLINNESFKDNSQAINRGFSPTAWLTLIAILVIAVESLLYQRRKVG